MMDEVIFVILIKFRNGIVEGKNQIFLSDLQSTKIQKLDKNLIKFNYLIKLTNDHKIKIKKFITFLNFGY